MTEESIRLAVENVEPIARPPEFSDDALALAFAARHGEQLRYVAESNRWLKWDGGRWSEDSTLEIFDMARIVCRERAAQAGRKKKAAAAIASAKTIAAVERLARSDRRIAATIDQWDADPWLLATPGGAIDLRTGESRPNRRADYCTKATAVAPGGDCPIWCAFLERITGGDGELRLFLQRVLGYCTTGITREHALFFGWGRGGNGKSVLLGTVARILGDYATTAPVESFIASNQDKHPTDLAGLRGARLVTATETEEGRRWAEAKVKQLTGGDRIAARFMRQDFFEFTPQFKLFVVGNHKPGLRSIDEAIRRRLHLIPFSITIPEEERDEKLAEKLVAEWPGILAWLIEGAAEWGGEGLKPPEIVRAATDEYLEAEDAIATWIAEGCELGVNLHDSAARLYASWKAWAERATEPHLSQKRFSQALAARGFRARREGGTGARGFDGLRAIQQLDGTGPWWER